MNKAIKSLIPVCKMCGRELGVFVGMMNGKPRIIGVSDYIDGWDYCESCMIEHCCATNCFGCEFNPGNYNDCRFLGMKTYYMENED